MAPSESYVATVLPPFPHQEAWLITNKHPAICDVTGIIQSLIEPESGLKSIKPHHCSTSSACRRWPEIVSSHSCHRLGPSARYCLVNVPIKMAEGQKTIKMYLCGFHSAQCFNLHMRFTGTGRPDMRRFPKEGKRFWSNLYWADSKLCLCIKKTWCRFKESLKADSMSEFIISLFFNLCSQFTYACHPSLFSILHS